MNTHIGETIFFLAFQRQRITHYISMSSIIAPSDSKKWFLLSPPQRVTAGLPAKCRPVGLEYITLIIAHIMTKSKAGSKSRPKLSRTWIAPLLKIPIFSPAPYIDRNIDGNAPIRQPQALCIETKLFGTGPIHNQRQFTRPSSYLPIVCQNFGRTSQTLIQRIGFTSLIASLKTK